MGESPSSPRLPKPFLQVAEEGGVGRGEYKLRKFERLNRGGKAREEKQDSSLGGGQPGRWIDEMAPKNQPTLLIGEKATLDGNAGKVFSRITSDLGITQARPSP